MMTPEGDHARGAKFAMSLDADGIVRLVWEPRTAITLADAEEAVDAMVTLTNGERAPLLVDVREGGIQDRAARMKFIQSGDIVSAVALVVQTPLSRALGNFFLAVSKPMAPTRLFDDDGSAVAWLRGFAP